MPAEEGARCFRCGNVRDVRRFCPACGSEQLAQPPTDRIVGETFADRYVVTDLLAVGAMGRVYRAAQRALNRKVALKVIHPHLLTSEDAVARFLREAQAASRLSHPNVVSVFDFGRTPEAQGGHLYLVMELLAGETLGSVMRTRPPLSLPRIVRILRQVLAALAEAHFHGITHRDVKPENIFIQQQRDGQELVKVIDFGVARLASHAITVAGLALGTPQYIAPEVALGAPAGPAADLYSVGIVLFEMLTGQVPFQAVTPTELMAKHVSAPRPDPRRVAPERGISARLAEVCTRAMAIDVAQRFASAQAFSDALARATRELPNDTSWAPGDTEVPSDLPADGRASDVHDVVAALPPYRPPAESLYDAEEMPLVGRLPDLTWAGERLAERGTVAIVIHGRTGVGRSRLLRELAALGLPRGTVVVRARGAGAPMSEVGFAGLRPILAQLVGTTPDDEALASGAVCKDGAASAGLRVVFQGEALAEDGATGRAAAAALEWCVATASNRARDARVAIVFDDLDRTDKSSRDTIKEALSLKGMRRALLLASTTTAPRGFPRDRTRLHELRGLPRTDALCLIQHGGAAALLDRRGDDEVEPLYAEQVGRLWASDPAAEPAVTLAALVEQRMGRLGPAERRVLQAVALCGSGALETVAAALARPADLDDALRPLAEAGFIEVHQAVVCLTHAIFGRVALDIAPAETVAEVHARMARALETEDHALELRLHHALRGEPDQAAFALVPRVAELRWRRDDQQGAISALWEGLHAAKGLATAEPANGAASDAWVSCVLPLATVLTNAERFHEAEAALGDLVRHLGADDPRRAELYDRLAELALELHRPRDAERLRREAREARQRVAAAALTRSPAVSGVMARPDDDHPPEVVAVAPTQKD